MVILVDENDVEIGIMPKLEAHEKALLHRAFSVFIFNSSGELLLQKRAACKYHSAGLWTNTCCSHEYPGQGIVEAAHYRLMMEMGIKASLRYVMKFRYKSPYDNKLTEHEIDHIFVGFTDDLPVINPDEVAEYKYMSVNDIKADLRNNPDNYTTWFHIIFRNFLNHLLIHEM